MGKVILKYPFNGSFQVTFSFGELPTNQDLLQSYKNWGIKGHAGIDFGMPANSKILACAPGQVVRAETDPNLGNYIVIKHSWGESTYAHLNQFEVKVGDKIKSGKLIGLSGDTGTTTGPHLHFAIKPKNPDTTNGYLGYIDPKPFFR